MLIRAIVLAKTHITCEVIDRSILDNESAYGSTEIAEDATLFYHKHGMEYGHAHNATASLIAQRQVYGAALIVGYDRKHHTFTDAPERYVETYEINEQEKQGGKPK